MIPPPQGYTRSQSLGITGSPYMPRISAPQIDSLSGSTLDDMEFNNIVTNMLFNNTSEKMEYNT